MSDPTALMTPELERTFYRLYRDFFDQAERRRRWNLERDIPWDRCNPELAPVVAAVVESFCAVEMYLPDYTAKLVPLVRSSRGRAWTYFTWGYEEAKHSLALGDWLLKSGHRSDEEFSDLSTRVFEREWNLPHDTALGMLAYTMLQERATWLSYRNLMHRVKGFGGDPALEKILTLLMVDEAAHHVFFRDAFELFLKHDRDLALTALRRAVTDFRMPAVHDLLDNPKQRLQEIADLDLFTESSFYGDVLQPLLHKLNIDRRELRSNRKARKSVIGHQSSVIGQSSIEPVSLDR